MATIESDLPPEVPVSLADLFKETFSKETFLKLVFMKKGRGSMKRYVVILTAVLFLGLLLTPAQACDKSGEVCWDEMHYYTLNVKSADSMDELNDLLHDGWEVYKIMKTQDCGCCPTGVSFHVFLIREKCLTWHRQGL